jgi:predicted TIM-barrel fold metal-dependent hydrolase
MVIDCHNHIGVELSQYLQGGFPYGQHLQDLVTTGRAHGVDRWIVFPMVTHLALNLNAVRDGECETNGAMESVPYRWENRRMMAEIHDLFPAEGQQVLPFAMFDPSRETGAQASALRQLWSEHRYYGLKTQPTIIQSPITALHQQGRVFLELAEEWNIPLLIHSSVLPSDIWSQAQDIIDIAEANPKVRFCVAHSARFDRECLDRIAALENCWFDCSAHGIHCQLAVQDSPVVAPKARRFASDYRWPAQVLRDLAESYPRKLLWGSDSPYQSYVATHEGRRLALLSTYEQEAGYFFQLPPGLQNLVGYANTLAWLGVSGDSLS